MYIQTDLSLSLLFSFCAGWENVEAVLVFTVREKKSRRRWCLLCGLGMTAFASRQQMLHTLTMTSTPPLHISYQHQTKPPTHTHSRQLPQEIF